MDLEVKLFGEEGKKLNLTILFKEFRRTTKPNIPLEEQLRDERGQLIEDSNLIFLGEFNLEEKENYSNGNISLEYNFKKGTKIPEDVDFIVVNNSSSSQEISADVNKRFRYACYAKLEKNVNCYNNSRIN